MKVIHRESGTVLGQRVVTATSFWRRLRGYMLYAQPPSEFDGIYFPKCNQLHNSFVRFSLDLIFIDRQNVVVAVVRGFRPWRFTRIYFKAAHALEFPAGRLPESISIGDHIVLEG